MGVLGRMVSTGSIRRLLFGAAHSLSRRQKQVVIWLVDVIVPPVAVLLVAALDPAISGGTGGSSGVPALCLAMAGTGAAASFVLGLPFIKLKSYENAGLGRLLPHALVLGAAFAAVTSWSGGPRQPLTGIVAFTLIALLLSHAARLAMLRVLLWALRYRKPQMRVLIYGAGATGLQLALALRSHDAIRVFGFIDDDPGLHRERLMGLPIHPARDIENIVRNRGITRIILAMPSAPVPRQARIGRRLQALGLEVQLLPSFAQMVGTERIVDVLTPLVPGAFLGRKSLEDNLPDGSAAYRGRSVMITGAGGTIGGELCRLVLDCRPHCLVLFEMSEAALYAIDRELRALAGKGATRIVPVLGSVGDSRAVRQVLADHSVEIVLHAAAYKHVPLVEGNPVAGLANNVLGTRTLAETCVRAGVGRFLLISTDKAVRPANVMGASKRLAEIAVQDLARRRPATRFAIVRFGNVLGSSGSVIPLFREQIRQGGPVTLTHAEVTRYFMTIDEAARLVLLAGSFRDPVDLPEADVFVLDMGKPVRIRDLALRLIEAAGCTLRDEGNPAGDIEIRVTGLRPGEKLHEELLIGAPGLRGTPHPKILRAPEDTPPGLAVDEALRELERLAAAGDGAQAAALAMRIARGGMAAPGRTAALVAIARGA